MIRHLVMWKFKDEYTSQEKADYAQQIKTNAEALLGVVPGLVSIQIIINPLPSASHDLMLDSVLESEDALAAYQIHPSHQAAASLVRATTTQRACIDYRQD